ncbi:MAG TPA: tetratricopeptide repeat protein [Myxococcota bacterium]|nr:tetratricopeptide repeat protein [Myxococcota bacterium]
MSGYTARDVAKMLGLSLGQVRSYVRAGFLTPERGRRGEFRFAFQDIVLLRTAAELVAARIQPRQVQRALQGLRAQLPRGRSLTGVRIAAEGNRIVVTDGSARWLPESGQGLFNFEVAELVEKAAPLARRAAASARRANPAPNAEEWYELGCELEVSSPKEARDAYRRAIELAPRHADAHLNLGRLLHEAGQAAAAEAHYRLALDAKPHDPTAAFNLGVALEDQGRRVDAVAAYERALGSDPRCADAHYNLGCLLEKMGRHTQALRHLKSYRRLSEGR